MNKYFKIFAALALMFIVAQYCLAIDLSTKLGEAGTEMGVQPGGTELPAKIGAALKVVIGISGIILAILVVYAGVTWMTAGGDPGAVKKAREHIVNGVIGLIICLLAYALTQFIVTQIETNVLSLK
ncbi:hypothetical protein HY932_02190 [Candidatus Falkowbacteria bacterium]|nr:hypothetical protein [Candidatus Falkowbacteria bacterium]